MTSEEFVKDYLIWNRKNGYRIQHHIGGYGLIIDSHLRITYNELASLPDNMRIYADLEINNCPNITRLPKNLFIGASSKLILSHTGIRKLPDCLDVSVIVSQRSLEMSEDMQLKLIKRNEANYQIIKNPSDAATLYHQVIWEL